MTLEAYIVQNLESDAAVTALFASRTSGKPWLYSSGAVGEGSNPEIPEFPYVVYNELPSAPHFSVKETSNSENRFFTFHVYDHMGDFTRINDILSRLRTKFKNIAPFRTTSGGWCSDVEWQGVSGRIQDAGYHSGVRFATVRFTYNG